MPALRITELDRRHRRQVLRSTVLHISFAWVALLLAYFLAPFEEISTHGPSIVRIIVAAAIFVILLVYEVRRILNSDLPQIRAISAVGILAPLVLVMFAGTYLSMSLAGPSSFNEDLSHVSVLYFSISTLATVGFGDIVARSDSARILVSVQILIDLLLLGSIVRLLGTVVRNRLEAAPATAPTEPPREDAAPAEA